MVSAACQYSGTAKERNQAMPTPKFKNSGVARAFAAYSPLQREKLSLLRNLILQTARETDGVGLIDEVLRWQQPAYLTSASGSGSTIRIDAMRGSTESYAIYFNCNTTLIDDFRLLYPKAFKFEGNRALVFNVADALPMDELRHCISLALTYHLRKKQTKKRK